jgi:hypothetical protein
MLMSKSVIMKSISQVIPVFVIILLSSCSARQEVTVKELQNHVKYLSSDMLGGRMTGSEGDSLAALYIRKELSSYGFVPVSGDGFQRFKVTSKLSAGESNRMELAGRSFIPETDFTPFAFSSNSTLEADVVFAGYGFKIDQEGLKWNDYDRIDVKGKWALVLRADPEPDKADSPFIPFSNDRDKAMVAKDLGAAGLLLVSGPGFDEKDAFESLNSGDFSVGIPVLRIKRSVADIILSKTGKSIESLEKKLNDSGKPSGFVTGTTISASAEIVREMSVTRNVVMILPGEDEQLKNEYIIIGAHYDHLGMGGTGSGSRATDTIAVHHGADDNASGVAMMLELAEKIAAVKGSHKRSIICVAFSGEEMGLLGSKYYVENPGIELSDVNAMINLDMVGRFGDTGMLQVTGVGTATGLKDLVTSLSDTSVFSLSLSDEGYGPSDHSSFYGKNIPVLFFSTGAHLDYHTPADTWDKVNYQGIVTVASFVYKIFEELASSTGRLEFRESGPRADQSRQMRRRGVTLGIMPDFAGNIKNGLRADFVTPGKPAALGGMKKGDIITSINGMTVSNIQDYMFRMSQMKHGQTINIEVLRGSETVVLLIQL